MEVLYTICHRVGVSYASLPPTQLFEYAQHAFGGTVYCLLLSTYVTKEFKILLQMY